jgi:uncharacterized membrane protein
MAHPGAVTARGGVSINDPTRITGAIVLSVIGVGLIAVSGWLGAEMVMCMGSGSRFNAPKS